MRNTYLPFVFSIGYLLTITSVTFAQETLTPNENVVECVKKTRASNLGGASVFLVPGQQGGQNGVYAVPGQGYEVQFCVLPAESKIATTVVDRQNIDVYRLQLPISGKCFLYGDYQLSANSSGKDYILKSLDACKLDTQLADKLNLGPQDRIKPQTVVSCAPLSGDRTAANSALIQFAKKELAPMGQNYPKGEDEGYGNKDQIRRYYTDAVESCGKIQDLNKSAEFSVVKIQVENRKRELRLRMKRPGGGAR